MLTEFVYRPLEDEFRRQRLQRFDRDDKPLVPQVRSEPFRHEVAGDKAGAASALRGHVVHPVRGIDSTSILGCGDDFKAVNDSMGQHDLYSFSFEVVSDSQKRCGPSLYTR